MVQQETPWLSLHSDSGDMLLSAISRHLKDNNLDSRGQDKEDSIAGLKLALPRVPNPVFRPRLFRFMVSTRSVISVEMFRFYLLTWQRLIF